jgi:hypothetical protein
MNNSHYRKLERGVDRTAGPEACWPWTGYRNRGGYGRVYADARMQYAHRLAWEQANGPIPAGLDICHTCDNPPCCNPSHLWAGTARENLRDAAAKGRLTAVFRTGEAATFHKLTWEAVRLIRARHAAGESERPLAREYGVSQPAIHYIVTGQTWPDVTNSDGNAA